MGHNGIEPKKNFWRQYCLLMSEKALKICQPTWNKAFKIKTMLTYCIITPVWMLQKWHYKSSFNWILHFVIHLTSLIWLSFFGKHLGFFLSRLYFIYNSFFFSVITYPYMTFSFFYFSFYFSGFLFSFSHPLLFQQTNGISFTHSQSANNS